MVGIFLFGISMGEVVLLFLVVLMLFGSKKIPELAKSLGKGMNEFRRAADDIKKEFDEETEEIKEDLSEMEANIRQNSNEIRDMADDVYRSDYGTYSAPPVEDLYGLNKPEKSSEKTLPSEEQEPEKENEEENHTDPSPPKQGDDEVNIQDENKKPEQ